jgi:hypothetical protein
MGGAEDDTAPAGVGGGRRPDCRSMASNAVGSWGAGAVGATGAGAGDRMAAAAGGSTGTGGAGTGGVAVGVPVTDLFTPASKAANAPWPSKASRDRGAPPA